MSELNTLLTKTPKLEVEVIPKYQFSDLETYVCNATLEELIPRLTYLFVNHFGISETMADEVLQDSLNKYVARLKPNLFAFIEYPYVDPMHRDSYYHFFARKLRDYPRNTIRISFFKNPIDHDDFLSATREKINCNYVGFLVLRPTYPQILGRNILSHEALNNSDFITCNANFNITVNSVKLKLRGYPHASQDYQSIKCAETSLWALLEYFGNKFPDYKPVLPSQIHNILYNFSFKRLIPSDGLTGEQLGFSLRELGFSPLIYSRVNSQERENEDFHAIISVYIESGLPVLGLIGSDATGHCINIIGRANDNIEAIFSGDIEHLKNGAQIIDYNSLYRKYIVMDDNLYPYSQISLNDPCELYVDEEQNRLPKWADCKLDNIIVPLPHKAYLDAPQARFILKNIMGSKKYGLRTEEPFIVKIFIATSRTYKDYIAKGDMDVKLKHHFLSLTMSKFIYVAEISTKNSFRDKKCDGILLLDATELSVKEGSDTPLSFLGGYYGYQQKGLFFRQEFGNFEQIDIFAHPFETFRENLM